MQSFVVVDPVNSMRNHCHMALALGPGLVCHGHLLFDWRQFMHSHAVLEMWVPLALQASVRVEILKKI